MIITDFEALNELLAQQPSAAAAKVAGVTPVECGACHGEHMERFNITRTADGVYDYDERACTPCAGTGLLPAVECYSTYVIPGSSRVLWRCSFCQCTVSPTVHLPGSEDCRMAADERAYSQADES